MITHASVRRSLSLLCVLALAPVVARAQGPISFAQLMELPAPPPTHRIAYGPGDLQFGNLRLPKGSGPHPVVLFIHGGCWLSRFDITHARALEQALADSGFAVWSLEYRRVGNDGGGWPGTFEDIARGADHLRALAPLYALDLTRVTAMGHSAGGYFALWLAARPKISRESPLYSSNPIKIRNVVGIAPAPDLEGLQAAGTCDSVIDKLMGGSPAQFPDRYAATSAMQLAPVGVPQVLVVGALDRTWGPVGRAYYARAVAAGDPAVRMVEAPEAGHFDAVAPTTSSWRFVIEGLRSLTASGTSR